MASTRRPRDSQISWPVPISVATATKRLARSRSCDGLQALVEHVAQALAGDQAGAREIEVEEAQHLAPRQIAGELLQRVELAGDVAAADHGADRGAGDDVGMDAGLVQRPQDADVRPPAGGAAAQRQTDLAVTHCRPPSAQLERSAAGDARSQAAVVPRCTAVNVSAEGLSDALRKG